MNLKMILFDGTELELELEGFGLPMHADMKE